MNRRDQRKFIHIGVRKSSRSLYAVDQPAAFVARFLSFQHFATARVALSSHSRFSDRANICLKLVGCLIFGEIKFLLDFRLAVDQFVITLLLLEGRANLGFQFGCALLRILDVGFQPRGAFFKSLHRGFERADGAQRRVGDAGAVTVFAAQNEFGGVVETGTDEQIKTGKASDADVLTETRF
jgi:hypothetical protein